MDNLSGDMAPLSVVVIGGCGIGLTLKADRVPVAGETVTGATFSVGEGGKGSNQAIGVRRLGHDAALISVTGDDDNGSRLRALWRSEGVADTGVAVAESPTMVGAILVEASGENRIIVAPGALTALDPGFVAAVAGIEEADALLASLEVPLAAVSAALRRAHAAGVPSVLNPAPAVELPADVLSVVDHLLPNESEAAAIVHAPPGASAAALVDGLRARFTGAIVLTLGENGALVDAGGAREHVDAHPVEAVDTTGAGDAFAAAYTVATAEGAEPVEAARFAAAAGALAVTRDEVIPALPHRTDVDALLAAART